MIQTKKVKIKTRGLSLCEPKGTIIRHRTAGTKAQIIGTDFECFVVYIPKEKKKLKLPFSQISNFEVIIETMEEWNDKVKDFDKHFERTIDVCENCPFPTEHSGVVYWDNEQEVLFGKMQNNTCHKLRCLWFKKMNE